MLDPITALLAKEGVQKAMATVPQGIKVISAIRQANKARRLEKTQRPSYEIPAAVTEATNNARAAYYDPSIPNADYITGKIGGSTASLIRSAIEAGRTPAEILNAATVANDNQNEALVKLGMAGSDRQLQEQQNLSGELGRLGTQQNQQWDYNRNQPYENNMKAAGALRQASAENLYNGVSGTISTILSDRAGKAQPATINPFSDKGYKEGLAQFGITTPESTTTVPPSGEVRMPGSQKDLDWNLMLREMQKGKYFKTQGLMPGKSEAGNTVETVLPANTQQIITPIAPTTGNDDFNKWKSQLPANLQNDSDYDLEGLYKSNPNIKPSENMHFPDTYKKPNHITFSNESIYNDPKKGIIGGKWGRKFGKDVFYAADINIKNAGGTDKLQEYFNKYEPGVKLVLPKNK